MTFRNSIWPSAIEHEYVATGEVERFARSNIQYTKKKTSNVNDDDDYLHRRKSTKKKKILLELNKMDIFGDDIDTLLRNDEGDNNDELNENIRNDIDIDEENEDADKKTDSEPIPVEPKRRAVRNPQVIFIRISKFFDS